MVSFRAVAADTSVRRIRVTVLNDDPEVLALFRELFEGIGCDVTTGSIVMPGTRELIDSRPDLILADLGLGAQREQLTGLQAIHSARSSTELQDVPIIVSSADLPALSEAWPDLMERGDVQQLEKPFDLVAFERVVEAALGLRHGKLDASAGSGRLLADADRLELDHESRQDG